METGDSSTSNSTVRHNQFEDLLEYLRTSRGFDFRGYKRTTLRRRVNRRMQSVKLDDYRDYVDYLEVHPEEFNALFNTILINVTRFFREPEAWDFLAKQIIPRIVESKAPQAPIRCWSVGCSSGEETCTLAIVLAEALGTSVFRDRVKIYATDVDEEALSQARHAHYDEKALEPVPEALREKYFERNALGFSFRSDLRRQIIFGRHDLVQDAPISHLDLIVCRNTLMYFNVEAQQRIVARLHFALEDTGYLFLGKAEMLLSAARLFRPVDLGMRIFARVPRVDLRERLSLMSQVVTHDDSSAHGLNLLNAAFDAGPTAQIVLDRQGMLQAANRVARALFGLTPEDIGRPFQDLEISYRPVELRSVIESVYEDKATATVDSVPHGPDEESTQWSVQVELLEDASRNGAGVCISFADVSRVRALEKQLQHSSHALETAFEELQSTNEELETTNEELQSTIEELETTNEELQSTNEELETMNEELQSTNEELETVNDELRQRSDELFQANSFQESLVTSLPFPIVLLDRELRVKVWNQPAENLWGLRFDEVRNQSLFDLDVGFDTGNLRKSLENVVRGESPREEQFMMTINRRGRTVQILFICSRFILDPGRVEGVILTMVEKGPSDENGRSRENRGS